MKILSALKQAISQIMHTKLRACLAMIGIVVGTASVVTLISSSQLATDHALSLFKSLGTNLVSVRLYNRKQNDHHHKRKLTLGDVNQLQHKIKVLSLSAPYASSYQSIHYNGKAVQISLVGATPSLANG